MLAACARTRAQTPSLLTSNLVSWWRGEAVVYDSVTGRRPESTWNLRLGAGKIGQAYDFYEGWLGDLRFTAIPEYSKPNFTVEAWVKRAGALGAFGGVGAIFGSSAGTYTFGVAADARLVMLLEWDNKYVYSTKTITDMEWHHVAATLTKTNILFYIDGQPAGAESAKPNLTSATPYTYRIGTLGSSQGFWGWIDGV